MSTKSALLMGLFLFAGFAGGARAESFDVSPPPGFGEIVQWAASVRHLAHSQPWPPISMHTPSLRVIGSSQSPNAEQRALMFIAGSSTNLFQDMAKGHGEYLSSLATLMGIPPARHAGVFAYAQDKCRILAASGDMTPVALLEAIKEAKQAVAASSVAAGVDPSH